MSISLQDEDKKELAMDSVAWALRNKQLAQMFPQLQELPGSSAGQDASAPEPPNNDGSAPGPSQGQPLGTLLCGLEPTSATNVLHLATLEISNKNLWARPIEEELYISVYRGHAACKG